MRLILASLLLAGAAPAGAQDASSEEAPAKPSLADAVERALDDLDPGQEAAEPAPPQPAAAAAAAEPPPPLSGEELAAIEETAARGRLLSEIAAAGILTTRDLLGRLADPEGAGIVGWVAEPEGNGMRVTYFAEGPDEPVAVYRGTVLGGRVVSRELFPAGERPPLPAGAARLASARAAATALDHEPCGEGVFNVLVVPPANPADPVDVYELTAPSAPGRFPFGGHYRTRVAPDGSVESERSFAEACEVVEVEPLAEGESPRPLQVVHLLDRAPTEVHVFLSRLTGRPLVVATGASGRVWGVAGGSIRELRD